MGCSERSGYNGGAPSLMSYGKDERDIHKHVWQLPIPKFDPAAADHQRIVDAAGVAPTWSRERMRSLSIRSSETAAPQSSSARRKSAAIGLTGRYRGPRRVMG
jgi:hypothetical protein